MTLCEFICCPISKWTNNIPIFHDILWFDARYVQFSANSLFLFGVPVSFCKNAVFLVFEPSWAPLPCWVSTAAHALHSMPSGQAGRDNSPPGHINSTVRTMPPSCQLPSASIPDPERQRGERKTEREPIEREIKRRKIKPTLVVSVDVGLAEVITECGSLDLNPRASERRHLCYYKVQEFIGEKWRRSSETSGLPIQHGCC